MNIKPFTACYLAAALLCPSLIMPVTSQAADTSPPRWDIQPQQSQILFHTKQLGADFTGQFEDFDAHILFAADMLDRSRAEVTINMMSVKTGNEERDSTILTDPWFKTAKWPQAKFITESFEKGEGANEYIAHGTLTIRDHNQPESLPFTLDISQNENGREIVQVNGSLTISRLDYNVGTGEWTDTSMVPKDVKIDISITAIKNSATRE